MWMAPRESFKGALPTATEEEKTLAKRLETHVIMLATTIGQRNVRRPEGLQQSIDYLTATMKSLGYDVREQAFEARGVTVKNLDAELKGSDKADEIVVIGAHYDSAADSPAANDNGSGVAAVIEMARALRESKPSRTIRFVFFVNEEPPFFQTDLMGSKVYAERSRQRGEKIVAMLSMETIGWYADEPGTQKYPPPFGQFFPSEGNFIAFVGDTKSKDLVERVLTSFRKTTRFPSEAVAAPEQVTGIGFSDQWSFWQYGYPALMVTDTALFRYPHYHTTDDTPDKIDYDRMSRVVAGVTRAVRELAGAK
ncbi:MAG: M20/M25/M40 family metallo-hydrolase [Burkholderiales bacterium]|nr:M20/M25/M40 family metallo-hydrolase [Phycisphaerae bacterium]